MGPIAVKVANDLRKARRSNVVDLSAVREARELAKTLWQPPEDADRLPPNHAAWMAVFLPLARLANVLIHMPALRKIQSRVDPAEEEYMPGGPPMSPVLDSAFINWWMSDLTVGPRGETILSVLADLVPSMGLPRDFATYARTLAESRLGVYRVTEQGPHHVELEALLTGERVRAELPIDLKSRGKLWLTRLLPPIIEGNPDWVVWTTPYLLEDADAEAQWTAYLERVLAGTAPAARTRRLGQHYKGLDDTRRWLDYIMDGYAGVTERGGILLSGVPDRPETLPQHDDYTPAATAENSNSPLDAVRRRLWKIANEHPFIEPSQAQVRQNLGAPPEPLFPDAQRLALAAYALYGRLDGSGRSALDLLAEQTATLSTDERQVVQALRDGWFSAFEIVRVRVDEGMEVSDVLRRKKLWIKERSATRQVNLGDVIAGWIVIAGDQITLEGGLLHVPASMAPAFIDLLREVRDVLARTYPKLGWKRRAGLLAQWAGPVQDVAFQQTPPPVVIGPDGKRVELTHEQLVQPKRPAEAVDLPPEAVQQVHATLIERMRRWVDEPIPMLEGKSPRQAVRSARGRDDVTLLLTRQQKLFEQGNLPPIDLSEIWAELGLQPPSPG